jgi:hypothetical protein
MVATLTAIPGALILTLDDPGRDDLAGVLVWGSTTTGFTPGAGNLKFSGKALTVVIANLTPLVPFYVRYAYVSEIDPNDYVIAAEISGTPNQIDGPLIATGAIRGKTLAGNFVMDEGTTITAAVAKPANVVTSTTVSVVDTTDFQSSGAACVYSPSTRLKSFFRYTGKTATSFTGVSGVQTDFLAGDVVLPIPFAFAEAYNYTGGTNLSMASNYTFPQAAGNAIAFGETVAANTFSHSGGQYGGANNDGLASVSGLTNFANAYRYIIANPGFPTAALTIGSKTSITLTGSAALFPAAGRALLISTTVVGYIEFGYVSNSGGVLTMPANEPVSITTAATYIVVPLPSVVVLGANSSVSAFSPLGEVILRPDEANFYHATFTGKSTYAARFFGRNRPAAYFSDEFYGRLQVQFDYMTKAAFASIPGGIPGDFGMVKLDDVNDVFMAMWHHIAGKNVLLQPIDNAHYFEDPVSGAITKINYTASTKMYRFDAAGVTAGGNIRVNDIVNEGCFAQPPATFTPAAGATISPTINQSAIYLNHSATIATLTITLPSVSVRDGHTINISNRAAVTALTVNGGTVRGAPTALTQHSFFELTFNNSLSVWYRSG